MGELADDHINGFCCIECGIYFEEEHGYPVACADCYDDEPDIFKTMKIQRATLKEL